MEIYKFNIEDFKVLETLLQISTEISKIYDKLCILEINNQKDSNEFHELLKELNALIKKETHEYKKNNLTHEDCLKFLRLLESKTSIPAMDTSITITLKHNDDKVIRRIMNNLLNILEQSKGFHQKVLDMGMEKPILDIMEGITKEDFLKGIEASTKVGAALENDIQSMFLSILEEAISYKSNTNYRNKLITSKYCILFSHKNIESMFIDNNFDIPSSVYISSKMLNQLLNQPEISYNFTKYMKLKSMAKNDINSLLNITDSEYQNPNMFFSSIIVECHIRALLGLMEGKNVDDLNQEVHDILNSPKYLSKHLNDRISENIVINCFRYFKKDRERVRTLSAKG